MTDFSFFESITQPGTSTIIASVITALVSIQTVFLKWLINSFASLRQDIKESTKSTFDWISEHEDKDQDRHEDNLKRFESISITLAKINGNTVHH